MAENEEKKDYAFKRPHEGHNDANFDLLAKSELLTGENTVNAINESTEKQIASDEEIAEKQLASDKENTEKVVTSNETIAENQLASNKENTEKVIASNETIAENQLASDKENADNIVEAVKNIEVKSDNTDIVNSLNKLREIEDDNAVRISTSIDSVETIIDSTTEEYILELTSLLLKSTNSGDSIGAILEVKLNDVCSVIVDLYGEFMKLNDNMKTLIDVLDK